MNCHARWVCCENNLSHIIIIKDKVKKWVASLGVNEGVQF